MVSIMLNLKVLPFSGGRYFVSEDCEVYTSNNVKLDTVLKDGIKYVELNWINGKQLYEVGLIVLSALVGIEFPDSFYNKIKVIYRDGNSENVSINNLTYVFSEPIETDVKGFYYIPCFPEYGVNKDGVVKNLKTGIIKKWYTTKAVEKGNKTGGYEFSTFHNSVYTKNIHKHRLLCLVFKPFTGNFSKLTVNHIDGNKNNTTLDNLEWASYSENNKHAWDHGLKLIDREKIYVRNLVTNEIKVFRSVRKAAEDQGDSSGHYISQRIEDKSGKIYPDLLQYKRGDEEWPEVDSKLLAEYDKDSFQNRFVARNVFTGEITLFDHAVKGEQLLGIPARIILDHARNSKFIPYNGYNFRYFTEVDKFPEHSERHLQIYKDYPVNAKAGVVAKDVTNGEELFFTSMSKCLEFFKVDFSYISTYIYSGRLFKKQWKINLFLLQPRKTSQSAAKLPE